MDSSEFVRNDRVDPPDLQLGEGRGWSVLSQGAFTQLDADLGHLSLVSSLGWHERNTKAQSVAKGLLDDLSHELTERVLRGGMGP